MGPTAPKAAIDVLRCQSPDCAGLLAYEVDAEGFLYVDLSWTAREASGVRYLPCPRCGGRNALSVESDSKGRMRPRVTRFAQA